MLTYGLIIQFLAAEDVCEGFFFGRGFTANKVAVGTYDSLAWHLESLISFSGVLEALSRQQD